MRSAPLRPTAPVGGPKPVAFTDIPQARRSVLPLRPRRRWPPRLGVGLLILASVLSSLAIVVPRWLNRQDRPSASLVAGQQPDRDGRLLGHFPYGEVSAQERVEVAPGLELQRHAAASLLEMQAAARAEGVELKVLSGFRSLGLQQQLFFGVKSQRNQSASERARVSAPPGYSEHSTGLAVDLGDASAPQTDLAEMFEETPAYAWLQQNAHRYHYVLSFPRGNAQGVNYEPWHWRFEGTAQALRIFEPAQRLNR